MKRVIICIIALMLLLTACGGTNTLKKAEIIPVNTAQDHPGYVPGEDYQQNWNDWGSSLGQLTAASELGYYYYDMFGDGLLHFHDFFIGQDNEQVLTYDLKTGETSILLDQGPVFLTLDGDRLYVDNSFYVSRFTDNDYTRRTVTVIDTGTLETLAVFPLTIHNSDFAGTSGGHILADTTFEYFLGDLDTAMSGTEPEWIHFNPKTEEGPE